MVHKTVEKGHLHDTSYCCSPGQMVSLALLRKVIAVDQLRLEQRLGGILDCDVSGCYDRILPSLASIHLQNLGMSKQIGTLLARKMYQTRHYVKTKH